MNYVAVVAMMVLTFWGINANDLQSLLVSRWFALLVGCGLVLAWRIGRRFHWTLGFLSAAVVWAGVSGAFLYDKYSGLPVLLQVMVKESAASALLCFLIPALIVSSMSVANVQAWRLALAILGPVASFVILVSKIWPPAPPAVIHCFDNASLAGTVVAVCLPLTIYEIWYRRWSGWADLVLVPMVISMCLLKTGTQLFAFLGAMIFVALVNFIRGRRGEWKSVALLGVIVAGVGLYIQPWAAWAHPSGRWMIWGWAFDIMKPQPWQVQVFGLGLGSTHWALPLWQQKVGYKGEGMFFTFHNDWLQIWVEMGLVGLTAALAAFSASIWRCRREPWLLAAVTAYGLSMVTNFTTHWALEAWIGFILARLVWRPHRA